MTNFQPQARHIHRRPGPAEVTAAVQDYAKAIYGIERRGEDPASTKAIAARLGVSAASASAMLKRMEEMGLIRHRPYHGVALTARGERVALEVMRHHRLIETYLAEALDMPWDRVHDEAEVLEHYISEDLEGRIAAALGEPEHDPHGDPIPTSDLTFADEPTASLAELEPGARGVFVRVSDSDPEMLRYLAERQIAPGDRLEVVERQPFGGPLSVRFASGVHVLGGGLADAMRVGRGPEAA